MYVNKSWMIKQIDMNNLFKLYTISSSNYISLMYGKLFMVCGGWSIIAGIYGTTF